MSDYPLLFDFGVFLPVNGVWGVFGVLIGDFDFDLLRPRFSDLSGVTPFRFGLLFLTGAVCKY